MRLPGRPGYPREARQHAGTPDGGRRVFPPHCWLRGADQRREGEGGAIWDPRTIGTAPVRKRAATADIVIAMSPTATSLRTLRNRAIILLGFAGAFRRSELVALNVEDLEEMPEGMLATLRRSKTDQEGLGRRVAIPRGEIACPVAALRARLDAAGITEGAIFRRIFNKRAQRVTERRRLAPRNVRRS